MHNRIPPRRQVLHGVAGNDGCAVGLWQHLHGLRDGNRSRIHRPATRSTSQTPPSASRTSQIGARYQDSCRFRSLTMYWSLTMSSSRQVLVTMSAAVDALQVPRPWDTDATSRPSRSRRCSSTSGRRPRGKRCSAAEHQVRWVQKFSCG